MSYQLYVGNLTDEQDWATAALEVAEKQQYADDVKERIEASAKVAEDVASEFGLDYPVYNLSLSGHVKQGDNDADTVNISVSGITNPVEVLT